jgi:hypothetical protein
MRRVDAQHRPHRAAIAVVVAMGAAAAGCGGDDFANGRTPPSPITVSAAISPMRVTVSPARFGAGAIELVASNQTPTSQRLTLTSRSRRGADGRLRQSTGPINPGDTASLTADLSAGRYLVAARSQAIDAATIVVGAARSSSRDRLLRP